MKLYTEAFDAIARIEEPGDRANEHLETVLSLLQVQEKSDQSVFPIVSESLGLIRTLEDPRQKLFLLRKAGQGFARMRLFSHALALAEEMDLILLDRGASSPRWSEDVEEQKDALFQEIALHQARSRENQACFETLEKIVDYDLHEETVLRLIRENAIPECSDELFELLETPVLKSLAAIALARHRRIFPDFSALETDADSLTELVSLYLLRDFPFPEEAQRERVLLETLEKFDAAYEKGLAAALIAKSGENDESALFTQTLRILLEATEEVKSISQRNTLFCELAGIEARYNRGDEARKTFRKALRETEKESNSFSRMKLLTELARSAAEAGERGAAVKLYRKASDIALSIDEPHLRGFYLKTISESLYEDHFLEEARETIESIVDFEVQRKKTKETGNERHFHRDQMQELHSILLHQKSLALSRAAEILREESGYEQEIALLLQDSLECAREIFDPILRAEALRNNARIPLI